MIKAIIVDDEARGRQTLQNLLKDNCPEVEVMELCDSAKSAQGAIEKHQPNLVFLDVEMPHQSGFDLLESLSAIKFDVIFTTAHSNHAIKAIKFSALDYLLKPIDIDELKTAVEKVSERKSQQLDHNNIEFFLQNTRNAGKKFEKIALPTADGFVFVNISEIIRCEASGSYTLFYFDKKDSLLVCKNLKEYEDLLTEMNFFRIHHSHLINLSNIQRYIRGDGGQVVMQDGSVIEVARRKKEQFLQKLMRTV
jgi:two-component system, LytTR family, response regulator